MRTYEIYFNAWSNLKYTLVAVEINPDNLGTSTCEISRHETYEEALKSLQYHNIQVHSSWGIKVYG